MRQYMPPQQQPPQSQSQLQSQQLQQQQMQQHAGPQPQASPVRTSSASSLQYHQRSPTATQHHYGPYAQGSPVPAAPPLADYSRHPSNSQPPTPLGPPSGVRAFAQPPSPYQQRMSVSSITGTPAAASTPAHAPSLAHPQLQPQSQSQAQAQAQLQSHPHPQHSYSHSQSQSLSQSQAQAQHQPQPQAQAQASAPLSARPQPQAQPQSQAQPHPHARPPPAQPSIPTEAPIKTPTQTPTQIPAQTQAPPQPQIQAQTQPSPKPAPPPATPAHRLSSQSSHGSSPAAEPAQRPQSQQGREQSLSVSPKTRLGSIPSNPDATPASADRAARSSFSVHSMAIDSDRAVTPAKRKLEDLNMSPGELEYKESKPPPGEVNGGYAERIKKSASPILPRKGRARHSQPPIWALSVHTLGRKLPTHANFVLQKRIHSHINTALNGKHEPAVKAEHPSRQSSPETKRSQHVGSVSQRPASAEPDPQDILGPWEASIAGVKPIEELSKHVADFLFMNVISNQDIQEITGRGIQFEIEAKLGTLIDKDTNQRVDRFVATECILDDNGRVAFRSSMTEAHHKSFNDFLNNVVIQTDPRNPNGGAKRVPVIYKHRREIDRFYDLPQEMHGHLPGCMRARLGARSRNVRVRVTHDQKTNQILNKIIKARVADIDLHMPMSPMDCRISINLEMNWDGSVEELEQLSANKSERQPDRNKDRLSYKQGHYQIDLTQVTHAVNGPGNSQRMDKEHELEIELSYLALLDQGRRAMSGAPHRYQELVEGFVDNVRLLARKAKEFTPRP
ncbi:putative mRNA capping nucleoside-triphosphatase [Trichoderma chlorosporum]